MQYTIYDGTTGLILGIIDTSDTEHLSGYDGYLEGVYDGNTYYIVDGTAVLRAELMSVASINKTTFTADGTDSVVISSLPDCIVAIVTTDTDYTTFNERVSDGELVITTTIEGTYILTIDCFPYQQYIVELEAE